MKVLHVITSLRTGGAEKLLVDLLPRLCARGIEADLLLFDGSDTPLLRQLRDTGVRVFALGRGGSPYRPLLLLRLIPYLRRYDVVHTHNTAPQLFAALGSFCGRATLVTTEHSTHNRRRTWPGFRLLDRWMYGRYASVVCISPKAETNLRAYLRHTRAAVATVCNGIDVARFAGAEPGRLFESEEPGRRAIITVAGFRMEKDQDTVIRAAALLPERFHAFFVGDGVRRAECEALARAEGIAGRVHFLGSRTDVAQLLRAADFVVMSSHWEGLSLSSIEGMSVGRPFLASDVDGLREVVAGAGLLFAHGDAQQLADRIAELDADPAYAAEVAARCLERARQYDLEPMVEGYARLYESISYE